MPTDMCALQDFDEPDKLHIQVNDVITIIEGRWVSKMCFKHCLKGLKIFLSYLLDDLSGLSMLTDKMIWHFY